MGGCAGKHDSRGLCKKHYNHHYKAGTLPPLAARKPAAESVCVAKDCAKPTARGRAAYCEMHYYRMRRHGSLKKPQNRKFCTAEGCDGPAFGLGLCQSHYSFKRRHDPDRPRCAEDGCARASTSRGYCDYHYALTYLPEMVQRHRTSLESRARSKKWRQDNPERWLMLSRNRKQRMRAQSYGVPVTKIDLEQILTDHGMVCHICGREIESRGDLHFDHVIPLSKGGPHAVENIRPSHATCNLRKAARLSA